MSTRERKLRKRRGEKFVRVSPTARSFSPEEWDEVVRFGMDRPELDDVEGMTFGIRLVAVAAGIGVVIVAAAAALLWVVFR